MDENNQAAATDTGADQSQVQEQVDNWGDAEAEFLADKGIKSDEQTDSKKTGEEAGAQAMILKEKNQMRNKGLVMIPKRVLEARKKQTQTPTKIRAKG
jgi:hypothetical protein